MLGCSFGCFTFTKMFFWWKRHFRTLFLFGTDIGQVYYGFKKYKSWYLFLLMGQFWYGGNRRFKSGTVGCWVVRLGVLLYKAIILVEATLSLPISLSTITFHPKFFLSIGTYTFKVLLEINGFIGKKCFFLGLGLLWSVIYEKWKMNSQ